MHKNLKDLLKIIVIPTVFFGVLTYWIFEYFYHGDMTLEGLSPEAVFPFWVSHLFLLWGYMVTMLTAYFVIRKKDIVREAWKK
ncbi:MAG: hypothetical protein KAJ44_03550 [Thermoplasmatales archaeon]|nr:hypothetical protein [Thermoplasmatales archaeon]